MLRSIVTSNNYVNYYQITGKINLSKASSLVQVSRLEDDGRLAVRE